jgi:hypothetical protein
MDGNKTFRKVLFLLIKKVLLGLALVVNVFCGLGRSSDLG